MPVVTRRQLLEAGVHFGHQTRRWNPKMRRFIYAERSGIYIVDLEKTLGGVEESYQFVRDIARRGGSVLFVGTKKQAQDIVAEQASRVGMPFVNTRWLGGMLTNFQTIHGRLLRLKELREMERSGAFEFLPKKEVLRLRHEKEKLDRNLSGIQDMDRLPEAVFIVDTKKEHIAITEANKLGIPIIAIVDTNCDPDEVQYVIPGNDDAIRAVTLVTTVIADAVEEGRHLAGKDLQDRAYDMAEEPARASETTKRAKRAKAPEPGVPEPSPPGTPLEVASSEPEVAAEPEVAPETPPEPEAAPEPGVPRKTRTEGYL